MGALQEVGPRERPLHNSCLTQWGRGGGHCCEDMCLIRLCGIKTCIPGTRINTDTQTDRQTGRDLSGLEAGTVACVCPHTLCPDQTFKALHSLFVIVFFFPPPILIYRVFQTGGWPPTWLADRLGPSRRQTEQEQDLGQHSSSAAGATRMLRQLLKVRESPASCWRGWRCDWGREWGGGGTVFIVNE